MIADLLSGFAGKRSVLAVDITTDQVFYEHNADAQVPAASTIKVPLLMAALEVLPDLDEPIAVTAADILPDSQVFEQGPGDYTARELLYWMIATSDNTATNRLIDRVGYGAVRDLCRRAGLRQTVLARKMLDAAARARGEDNTTSARDQYRLYRALYRGGLLDDAQCAAALEILRRQRSKGAMLRYIADPVTVAHKTGGLDGVSHDAGVFESAAPFFLGVFTWDGAWEDGSDAPRRVIGRIAKRMWEEFG